MKYKIKKLTAHELERVTSEFDSITFNNDFDFVYEEQVPNTAIIITDGELLLFKKNKLLEIIDPGHILGAYHLLHNQPVKFSCKIPKKSKAILLDKSTLLAAAKDPNSSLSSFLDEFSKEKT